MSDPHPRTGATDRGFILIVALAACLLLAAIGATLARSVQSALRSTTAAIELAKAQGLADGGVEIAAVLLAGMQRPDPWVCSVPGAGLMALTIEDEAGKVSLNSNNQALLEALFAGLGAPPEEARRYVALVADYRDPDQIERPGGGEKDAYMAAGLRTGPKNADFDTVSELDRVLGIPNPIREAAKPYLTAATAAAGVDEAAASPELLRLLGGERTFGQTRSIPASFAVASSRSVFKVRSLGVVAGARFVREATIAKPLRPGEPLRRLSWLQGEVTPADEALLSSVAGPPPC